MPKYTGWSTADPVAPYDSDTTAVSLGTCFRCTATGGTVTKVRMWVPTGGTGTLTGWTWGIFASTTGGATGSALVSGSFGTMSRGAWNEATLGTPYALTQNTYYYVVVWAPGSNYGAIAGKFTSTGITNGPLDMPVDSTSHFNGAYRYNASLIAPNAHFNGAWYGVDVEITVNPDVLQTIETDTANTILVAGTLPVAKVTETNTANQILVKQGTLLLQAIETDSAEVITPTSGLAAGIGQVTEINAAGTITLPPLSIAVGKVVETDSALLISPPATSGSKRDKLLAALRASGYTGTVSDMEYARLKIATANDGVGETMRDMVVQNSETNRLW